MTKQNPTNMAASVRQRLLNRSRQTGDDYNLLLTRYGVERLLYRLSRSEYVDQFVLKGAMLFAAWTGATYRPTRDLDLLGSGEAAVDRLVGIFRDICGVDVQPDGLSFDSDSVRCEEIREQQSYPGLRIRLITRLGSAEIPLQVDIGFGDAVTPKATIIDYPTLLGHPGPRIRAYPPEAVVAEKVEAMVSLGMANSRMKDFYDVWAIMHRGDLDQTTLVEAIGATFERRGTDIPQVAPVAFTPEFASDAIKVTQWRAFVNRSGLEEAAPTLDQVRVLLKERIWPAMKEARARQDGASSRLDL